ncbi:WD40/YVTN/BNR-like repeat-containing protein [Halopelagius fulvigenes]|uniref:WD40/YVTN/BNR-like repeat-containing protein n=1 Tax=Halopelagius fulvigenes TaxID=1198324 RepID=A0ABD5TUE5_9EURY
MTDSERRDDGFVAFYREYTKTWVHALATVALTAFGTLTTLDRLFAVVAIAAYVVPLVVQYLRYSPEPEAEMEAEPEAADGADTRPTARGTDEATGTNGGTEAEATAEQPTAERTTGDAARMTEPARAGDSGPVDSLDPETPDPPAPDPEWIAIDAATDETLFDAAIAGDDAYAVGSGGVVVAGSGTDDWRVVLPDGPGAGGNALRGVDSTPGGVWVAGDGGAVGRVDPETGRHVDYSPPDGDTSNVTAVAAAGGPGDETVLLADGSGRIRRGYYRDGELSWDDPVKPGSGSSVAGVVLLDGGVGFLCDTNDGAYRTGDGGRTFESVGPVGADGTLTDAAATGPETCLVAADDGAIHRYGGTTWTPERLCEESVTALSSDGNGAVACTADGAVYERFGSNGWERVETAASASLRGVAVGGETAVAVGDEGRVVERRAGSR